MIIGFSGRKESGKNTAADFVAEAFQEKFSIRTLSFAEKLKQSAAACFGIHKEHAVEWCDNLKREGHYLEVLDDLDLGTILRPYVIMGVSGREFLQHYGTEAHRDIFGNDFWCDQLWNEIAKDGPFEDTWHSHLHLITDVRFDNECEYIKSEGGNIFEITRLSVESEDTHASEQPVDRKYIDGIIHNNSSLEVLRYNVLRAIETMKWA